MDRYDRAHRIGSYDGYSGAKIDRHYWSHPNQEVRTGYREGYSTGAANRRMGKQEVA